MGAQAELSDTGDKLSQKDDGQDGGGYHGPVFKTHIPDDKGTCVDPKGDKRHCRLSVKGILKGKCHRVLPMSVVTTDTPMATSWRICTSAGDDRFPVALSAIPDGLVEAKVVQ